MSRATTDVAIAPILAELTTKQDAALTKNKKYAQLYPSHDSVPEVATDVKVDLVRDEDITPTLPAKLDFAFRVDELQYPDNSCGWMLWVWVKEGGKLYVKTWGVGLDADKHPTEWTETTEGPND